jgi:hypothetical protein
LSSMSSLTTCLASIKTQMKPFKLAVNDLVTMTRNALTAMKTAIRSGKKQKPADEEEARMDSGNRSKTANVKDNLDIFDFAAERGKAFETARCDVPRFPCDSITVPLLVSGLAEHATICREDGPVRLKANKFMEKFKKSLIRQTEGRAERLVKGDARVEIEQMFKQLVLGTAVLPFEKMHAELCPAAFGVAKSQETISTERARGATMRLQFGGCRQIVAMRIGQLREHMVKTGLTSNGPDAANAFVKSMNKSSLENFLKEGVDIFSATAGPNDMTILPFDWVFAERSE